VPQQVAAGRPAPKPAPPVVPRPVPPVASLEKAPAPPPAKPAAPKRSAAAIASGETDDFLFELTSVKLSGGELTFYIEATNKTDRTRQLALYDQSSRYTKSILTDDKGSTYEAGQIYLWEGETKTSAYDASRGIPVESKRSATIEMTFKEIPPAIQAVQSLNLHPYTATRMIFYKWSEADLEFKNIRIGK
jgi:hypothetical protein